jgi:hypothetical protein
MERHYGKARHAEAIAVASSRVGDAASCAMYGGRFETTAVGSAIGDVTEYDLNSAYPAAMRDLPCLVHGRWARTRTNHGPIAVSHLTFRHDTPDGPGVCHPLPVRRRTGELFYPREGRGWYWRAEYDRPGLDVTADVTYSWRPDGCDCRPFAWVADYYDRRKELDAATPGSGIPLKLTLNTLYGKNAQTRPEPGPWLNMVHASIITATVRRRMFDLYEALPPRSVVMFATDAIFVHAPHTLPTSDGLGGLADEHTYRELVIVQPGVYFDADAAHFKSRGMPRKVMAEHAVGLSVAAMMGSPYTLAHTVFVGVRVALALGRPEDAGQWIRPHREIATRTTSKRIGGTWVDDGTGAVCWTDPAPPLRDASGGLRESYWRQFAMAAREEAALADLWSDDLPTWDE